MKRVLLVMLMILIATAVSAKNLEITRKAGANNVIVTLQNDPPATGENTFAVAVRDASGKAVTDAKVVVEYGMPAMPGMPAMNYKTTAALKGQNYTGVLNFSMPGSWQVTVKIMKGGRTDKVKFNTDVH